MSFKRMTSNQHHRSVVEVVGGVRGQLTAVGPQHVNHSPWRAHNDLGSSLQLSDLEATMEQ